MQLMIMCSPLPAGKPDPSADSRAEEGRPVVPEAAAQAAGGPASPCALGLPAGGDAVDGHRLRPGAAVEGGCCQEGG